MDLVVKEGEGVTDIQFTNTVICVKHNYNYNSNKLKNITYQKTKDLANIIYHNHHDERKGVPELNGPRELVVSYDINELVVLKIECSIH